MHKSEFVTLDGHVMVYVGTTEAVNFEAVKECMAAADTLNLKCEVELKRVDGNSFTPRYDVHLYKSTGTEDNQ